MFARLNSYSIEYLAYSISLRGCVRAFACLLSSQCRVPSLLGLLLWFALRVYLRACLGSYGVEVHPPFSIFPRDSLFVYVCVCVSAKLQYRTPSLFGLPSWFAVCVRLCVC